MIKPNNILHNFNKIELNIEKLKHMSPSGVISLLFDQVTLKILLNHSVRDDF